MDTNYWKSSPFGEESVFHPSWEEKRKQERQILLNTGKIIGVFVTKGNDKYVDQYPVQDNLSLNDTFPRAADKELVLFISKSQL